MGLKNKTILILIGSHFSYAPRQQKEAMALREAGARVLVRGIWWDDMLAEEDICLAGAYDVEFSPVVDLRGNNWPGFSFRARQRIAAELMKKINIATPRIFGMGGPELLREARRCKADFTIVHTEVGLWVGKKLLAEGFRVGVDFDDWFSEDLLPEDRRRRPIKTLKHLERYMLRHACYCSTTTKALAMALAQSAGTHRIPVIIPNCFPASGRQEAMDGSCDERTKGAVSFHWFSQVIGPTRGLETLAEALTLLRGDWQVSLRGALRGYKSMVENMFAESIQKRVNILEPVSNAELLSRTMSHDVGLALEVPYCPSRNLTASNKIFEYFRAGLAVIATRTRGQEEVMGQCSQAGILVESGDAVALAEAMQKMIDEPESLAIMRQHSWEAGEKIWSWEAHAPTLVETVEKALNIPC